MVAHGTVILDDPAVKWCIERREELCDVASVLSELHTSVLKDEEHRFNRLIPHRNPVTVHFDGLGGFQAPTDEELEVADTLGAFLFMRSGIMAGKDVVEVDGTSGQETDPLRLGELRESQGVEERRFRCLEVLGYILEYRLCCGE